MNVSRITTADGRTGITVSRVSPSTPEEVVSFIEGFVSRFPEGVAPDDVIDDIESYLVEGDHVVGDEGDS